MHQIQKFAETVIIPGSIAQWISYLFGYNKWQPILWVFVYGGYLYRWSYTAILVQTSQCRCIAPVQNGVLTCVVLPQCQAGVRFLVFFFLLMTIFFLFVPVPDPLKSMGALPLATVKGEIGPQESVLDFLKQMYNLLFFCWCTLGKTAVSF